MEYHVAPCAVEGRVHGELAEEIADLWIFDGECTESVPKVVEGEEAFGSCL